MKLGFSKKKDVFTIVSGELEGKKFVGHYNFALLKVKSKADHPYMLGISISGFRTNKELLPTEEIRPQIDDYEDAIIALVESATRPVYAGHSFWNKGLELIFYIKEADFEKVVQALEPEAEKQNMLSMTFKIEPDPTWSQLAYLLGK